MFKRIYKFSLKIISVILIVTLVFSCHPCFSKKAFADEYNSKQLNFIPFQVVKDNVKVGNVESILVGYYGIEFAYDMHFHRRTTYFSYYELTPKKEGEYFNLDNLDKNCYWDARYENLYFLGNKACNNVCNNYTNTMNKYIKEMEDFDLSLSVDDEYVKQIANSLDTKTFVFGVKLYAAAIMFAIGACLGGLNILAGTSYLAFIMTTCAIGAFLGVAFVVGAVIMIAITIIGYILDTDEYWAVQIEKLGFSGGKGLLNISDGTGKDDGIGVVAMNNNEIIGWEETEWFKGDDSFSLDSSRSNKLVICGGDSVGLFGNWFSTLKIETLLNRYYDINKKYNYQIKLLCDRLVDIGFLSDKLKDFNQIKSLYYEPNSLKLLDIKFKNERIKQYIIAKWSVCKLATKELLSIKADQELIEFYNEAHTHIDKDDYEWFDFQIF